MGGKTGGARRWASAILGARVEVGGSGCRGTPARGGEGGDASGSWNNDLITPAHPSRRNRLMSHKALPSPADPPTLLIRFPNHMQESLARSSRSLKL